MFERYKSKRISVYESFSVTETEYEEVKTIVIECENHMLINVAGSKTLKIFSLHGGYRIENTYTHNGLWSYYSHKISELKPLKVVLV